MIRADRSKPRSVPLTRAVVIVFVVTSLGACVSLADGAQIPDDDDRTAEPVEEDTANPTPTPAEISVDEPAPSDDAPLRDTTTVPVTTQAPAALPSMLFPAARFLWEPIPADAVPDARSDAIVDGLNAQDDVASSLLVDYGIPVYPAGSDTPHVDIRCRDDDRGLCGPEQMSPIRIPVDAVPNTGTDGALVIVDLVEGVTHELWRAVENDDGSWSAQWGSSNDISGDAITANGGSGSGVSRLGGLIMTEELASGNIPHALAMASNQTCASAWRAPAWSTDGRSEDADCIEMGSRLQLDPSIDLDALSLTEGERIIGEALQIYGGYVVDSSASALAVFFEREEVQPDGGLGPVARSLDFRWDFDPLSGLPWDELVVLAPSES